MSFLLLPSSLAFASSPNAASPSWIKSATVYEVDVRHYSSSSQFSAITNDIPRLKKLGVGVLWLMPIYPIGQQKRVGSLGSPYSVADYRGINPEFGSAKDLKTLVSKAHAAGLHVILDWVANHTAWDNPWVSAHPDWYTQVNGQIISPAGTGWNDVADLNYDNQNMRAAMIAAMKYWVTTFNIDGFRCDAAGMVPQDFWEQATIELAKGKKLWMLAEDSSSLGLLDKAFNANYNWGLLSNLKNLASGYGTQTALENSVLNQANSYPSGTYPLNFITNHDENAWSGTVQDLYGPAEDAMVALTFTLPGVPLIFNGQEVGLNRQLKFFDKDSIDWSYYGDSGASKTLFYTQLISLKAHNSAVWTSSSTGSTGFLPTGNPKVMAILRKLGSNRVLTIVNLSLTDQTATVSPGAGKLYPFGAVKQIVVGKSLSLTLPGSGFAIYSSNH